MMRPCVDCGQPSETTRCADCRPPESPPRVRGNFRQRGYTTEWTNLSKRARRLQPWCTDCGSVEDLTADHLPSAWERQAQHKVIRLLDVDVVCRPCNNRRGSSRPGSTRGGTPADHAPCPLGEAGNRLHTPAGYR